MVKSPAPGSARIFWRLVVLLCVPFWLFGGVSLGLPVNLPIGSLLAFAPGLVAVVLIGRARGRAGVTRLLRSAVDPRGIQPRRWYLPILLTVPAVLVVVTGVSAVLGRAQAWPSWSVLAAGVGLTVLFLVAAVGEELGWTGYLLPALRERWGPDAAALLIGVGWGAIHLPGWYLQTGHTLSWTFGMWSTSIVLRVLIVRLTVASGGSILAAVLVHVTINLASLLFPDLYRPWLVAPVAVLAVVAVGLGGARRTSTGADLSGTGTDAPPTG